MQKRFKINKNFKPCLADDGDEFFANGIFEFNISKMISYIQNNLDGAERKSYLEDRFMDDFDPEHFDKDEINQQLKEWEAVWLNKWK